MGGKIICLWSDTTRHLVVRFQFWSSGDCRVIPSLVITPTFWHRITAPVWVPSLGQKFLFVIMFKIILNFSNTFAHKKQILQPSTTSLKFSFIAWVLWHFKNLLKYVWFDRILWYRNQCRLFNAKSSKYISILYTVLVVKLILWVCGEANAI